MKILVVNAGSSSLKFQLFNMPQEEVLLNLGHMIPYENWVKASEWE